MTKLLTLLAPKYVKFRYRYTNKLTGKVITDEWVDYKDYPTKKRSFGLFRFLWGSSTEFEKEPEVFNWIIPNYKL